MKDIHLAPMPQKWTRQEGYCPLQDDALVLLDEAALWEPLHIAADDSPLTRGLRFAVAFAAEPAAITVTHNAALAHEAYRLTVEPAGITVAYGDAAGAFYAFMTLRQLWESCGREIPCGVIDDAPMLPVRGYMMDVGRNRIPRREELFRTVDLICSLKINHLELYMEGAPFAYPSFPQMWEGRDVMSGEDILALDAYCKARFVDLVPTQNNFGHMDQWLKKHFYDLAECPGGYVDENGYRDRPHCLNPLDPRSEDLIRRMNDELLPYFSSKNYNVSCDETFELGRGASREVCEKEGRGQVYLAFLKKVFGMAKTHGKRPLFWDDVLKSYPELFSELPDDVIALEWGYSDQQPSKEACQLLREKGVHFFLCPGTAGWNTLVGRTPWMHPNIRRAGRLAKQYGADGLLNTDWGDWGHLQSPAVGYAGILYGACVAWDFDQYADMDLAAALDEHVFFDTAHVMGQLVLDAGRYIEWESKAIPNITLSFRILTIGLGALVLTEDVEDETFTRLDAFFEEKLERLKTVDLHCRDAALVREEYETALWLLRVAEWIGHYTKALQCGDTAAQKQWLLKIDEKIGPLIASVARTWDVRDRLGWRDVSFEILERIENETKEKLKTI